MLSVYLGALGLGALGLGAGLLVGGPIAVDRALDDPTSKGPEGNALDLHADRRLGSMDGGPDRIWRPLLCPHAWTSGIAVFGASGLGLWWTGASQGLGLGLAIALGLVGAWIAGTVLRSLPPRSDA